MLRARNAWALKTVEHARSLIGKAEGLLTNEDYLELRSEHNYLGFARLLFALGDPNRDPEHAYAP
eukprot:scaffold1900_cov389-Prasinococcus_capsulatus_cf.AAC.5